MLTLFQLKNLKIFNYKNNLVKKTVVWLTDWWCHNQINIKQIQSISTFVLKSTKKKNIYVILYIILSILLNKLINKLKENLKINKIKIKTKEVKRIPTIALTH